MNKRSIGKVLVLLVGLIVLPFNLWAQDDWQYWHQYQLSVAMPKSTKFLISGQQRLRDNFSESFHADIETGLLWKPLSYLEAGPFFKYQREKTAKGDHINENRYSVELSLTPKWRKFTLKDRNRFEYRNRNTTDGWRYRNQIKVSFRFPARKIELEPYLSEEIFYDFDAQKFNQSRASVGLTTHLHKHVSVSLFYLLQSKKTGSNWREDHVLGSQLVISV